MFKESTESMDFLQTGCIQIGFYKMWIHDKYDKCFFLHADNFSSDEMTLEECFRTMMPLHASRDVTCR